MYNIIFYDNFYVFKHFKIFDESRVISFIIQTQRDQALVAPALNGQFMSM